MNSLSLHMPHHKGVMSTSTTHSSASDAFCVQVLQLHCRSGLIVYSTMLNAEDLFNGALLDLGRPVHDAATVGLPSLDNSEQSSGFSVKGDPACTRLRAEDAGCASCMTARCPDVHSLLMSKGVFTAFSMMPLRQPDDSAHCRFL